LPRVQDACRHREEVTGVGEGCPRHKVLDLHRPFGFGVLPCSPDDLVLQFEVFVCAVFLGYSLDVRLDVLSCRIELGPLRVVFEGELIC
jgi:hypothetical protein